VTEAHERRQLQLTRGRLDQLVDEIAQKLDEVRAEIAAERRARRERGDSGARPS
jgi:hypothetical protein